MEPIGHSLTDTLKAIQKFQIFVDPQENEEFIQQISKEGVLNYWSLMEFKWSY